MQVTVIKKMEDKSYLPDATYCMRLTVQPSSMTLTIGRGEPSSAAPSLAPNNKEKSLEQWQIDINRFLKAVTFPLQSRVSRLFLENDGFLKWIFLRRAK